MHKYIPEIIKALKPLVDMYEALKDHQIPDMTIVGGCIYSEKPLTFGDCRQAKAVSDELSTLV